jgi:ABC-type glycerol-3-phosphate transport system substrate-binding protein
MGRRVAGPVVVWQAVDYLVDVTGLMKARFEAVAKEKGIQLTFEEIAGNVAGDRFTAAIQANTPPDIWRLFDYETQYWRRQNQIIDVSEIVKPASAQKGGFWPAVEATASFQGKWYSVPMAVNCWPMHVRQDLLDKAGVQYPKNWEEFRQQGRQLTKPPLYYYGMNLFKNADNNNHFTGMLWTYGGKLQNEDGSLAVKADDKAWIETLDLINLMFNEDKIIPPGALNWDAGANNTGFQSEQLVITSNPTSIYNWLINNKPELAKGTKFYNYPAGPAGSFGQVDVWALAIFKNGKGTDGARTLLTSFLEPAWYEEYVNKKLAGRFVPVYKDMIKDDLWSKNPLYDQYQKIIENGRIMAYAGIPHGGTTELLTKNILGELMQDVLVKKQKSAEALATFVKSATEIYNKPENKA